MLYHFLETQFLVSLLRRNNFRTSPPEQWSKKSEKFGIYLQETAIHFIHPEQESAGRIPRTDAERHGSCCLRQHFLQSDTRSPRSQEPFEFQVKEWEAASFQGGSHRLYLQRG